MACTNQSSDSSESSTPTAEEILGNPEYQAISYSGYRGITRDIQPTVAELKEDMLILEALGIKIVRTYNLYLDAVPNLLKAISELKEEDPELYSLIQQIKNFNL